MVDITEHLALARKLAWSFQKTTGLPYEDLEAEAFLGLCRAGKNYDDSYGTAFSTFAYSTITFALKYYLRRQAKLDPESSFSDFSGPQQLKLHQAAVFTEKQVYLKELIVSMPASMRRVLRLLIDGKISTRQQTIKELRKDGLRGNKITSTIKYLETLGYSL